MGDLERAGHCSPCHESAFNLEGGELLSKLRGLAEWTYHRPKLLRVVEFPDFLEAIRFINALAGLAEAEGHHPDFSVHYNRVTLELWTFKTGGLTDNDFLLAEKISQLVSGWAAR